MTAGLGSLPFALVERSQQSPQQRLTRQRKKPPSAGLGGLFESLKLNDFLEKGAAESFL
jgi:hypothetical protein